MKIPTPEETFAAREEHRASDGEDHQALVTAMILDPTLRDEVDTLLRMMAQREIVITSAVLTGLDLGLRIGEARALRQPECPPALHKRVL
jgi:hypothetical protein